MTNSLLFEGPILEEVLSEARLCFGGDVEIEAANRVRRGGVFGFFSSEWFEVWARPSTAAVSSAALTMLDREEAEADVFQRMVRSARSDDRLGGTPIVETPTEDYESALDHFFGDNGGAPGAPERTLVTAGAPAAHVAQPQAAPTPTATSAAQAAPMPTASSPAEGMPMQTAVREPIPAAIALEDPPRGESVFATKPAPKADLLWAMLDRLDQVPSAPPLPTEPGLVVFAGDAAAALEVAHEFGERSARWNGVIAVLSRSAVVDGVPPWLLINEFADLQSRSARWRQSDGIVPVVLDIGVEAVDRKWAIQALTEMRADQCRLVVEAWRLAEDVGRLAGKLGGVDTLELVSVADTVDPLAMLDLGIPIGSIEGRPANSELLAAVWLENRRRG